MKIAIDIVLLIVSIILIISVILQESKSDGLSGAIGGGAEQLFGKKKSSGYQTILHRITVVTGILFFVLILVRLIFF